MLFTDMDLDGPVRGSAYSDWFQGGAGPDRLEGGLNMPTPPYAVGFGDTVDYTESNQGVNVDLGDQDDEAGLSARGIVPNISGGYAEGDQLEGIENAVGSRYNDNLFGDRGNNKLFGGRGNDFLWGDAGNDQLWGDSDGGSMQDGVTDEDILHGGHDELVAGTGNDLLEGGMGADMLDGGPGIDTARYTRSNAGVTVDLMKGTGMGGHAEGDMLTGIENLRGSMYDDMLTGDDDPNTVDKKGNPVNINHIDGAAGDDMLKGGAGNDVLWGGMGDDDLWGGDGMDHLVGDVGSDTLEGGAGADWITGDGGGTGGSHDDARDAASYTKSDAVVTVDLSAVNPQTGAVTPSGGHATGDDLFGIEDIIGSNVKEVDKGLMAGVPAGDMLTGDDSANRIWGKAGDDTIDGGKGADTLDGGEDADKIMGGDGDDMIMGGADGADTQGGKGKDGADMLYGEKGDDTIMGGPGDDMIMGGDGADSLMGDAGNDRIAGGAGDDMLTGGVGGDTFVFSGKFGNDTITDFANGSDKVDIPIDEVALQAVIDNRMTNNNGDVVLTFNHDLNSDGDPDFVGTITLEGYSLSGELDAAALL